MSIVSILRLRCLALCQLLTLLVLSACLPALSQDPPLARLYSCCRGMASSWAAADETRQMDLMGARPPTKRCAWNRAMSSR